VCSSDLDGTSNPATINDISVKFDGTSISGSISEVDASSSIITITESKTYWDSTVGRLPHSGDEFIFGYHYLNDGTNYDATSSYVFGISYWQMPTVPVLAGNDNGDLAVSSDMTVSVNGIVITDSVESLDPLMGHVVLNSSSDFWYASSLGRLPRIGDVFSFDYKTGERYQYSMLFDDPGRVFDSYYKTEPYGLVFDGDLDSDPEISPITSISYASSEIGYRWRSYLLHHSSVLNSSDTLRLNTYQKPGNRASIANQMDVLNHFNKVFSPEFLNDTNDIDIKHLDDSYLENGLDPVLKLNEGTPPFQKTFWSKKTLITHKKVQDIRTNHKILIYSDLLIKEFRDSEESVPLTSICDSNSISFKIRMGQDEINPISECDPWILFDSVETEDVEVTIPGELRGVPSLRVPDIYLINNFILRNLESTGTAVFTYSTKSPLDQKTMFYQLPSSYQYKYQDEWYDFPSLPVMKDEDTQAGIDDIEVKINGVSMPGIVKDINPVTGLVELYPMDPIERLNQYVILTEDNIKNRYVDLPYYPYDFENISLNIVHGIAQYIIDDFYLIPLPDGSGWDKKLIWEAGDLYKILEPGDVLVVSFWSDPNINIDVEFTYKILSSQIIKSIDKDRTRIFDNGYVFNGRCYDIESVKIDYKLKEYINFMDDCSDGIKLSFFNNSSLQVEEHVFSGPIFEYWSCDEDEIGSPQNYPNALVRIQRPIRNVNPLNSMVDYSFMNDKAVRFRKKTFKELLDNRTFRTVKLVEMLPV
jgi:hypothetical protein